METSPLVDLQMSQKHWRQFDDIKIELSRRASRITFCWKNIKQQVSVLKLTTWSWLEDVSTCRFSDVYETLKKPDHIKNQLSRRVSMINWCWTNIRCVQKVNLMKLTTWSRLKKTQHLLCLSPTTVWSVCWTPCTRIRRVIPQVKRLWSVRKCQSSERHRGRNTCWHVDIDILTYILRLSQVAL